VSNQRCPVCNHPHPQRVFAITRKEVDVDAWLYQCLVCDYHFVLPLPSAAFLNAFYGEEYGCYVSPSPPMNRALERRVHRLLRIKGKPGKLLDVGGGNGAFIAAALNLGWDAYSLETSAVAHRQAQAILGKRAIHASIEDLDPDINNFDVVTAWAVIEHLTDPIPIMKAAVSRLRAGGTLYLQTPYIRSLAARRFKDDWRLIKHSPDHVGFFTLRTIQHLCTELRLDFVSSRLGGMPFPFGRAKPRSPNTSRAKSITKPSILHAIKHDLAGRIARLLSGTLRLGDNIEFVLQKQAGDV